MIYCKRRTVQIYAVSQDAVRLWYYLDYGGRDPKRLWAGDEERQIDLMIKLHDSFKEGEKPQWLTMDKILEYKKEMMVMVE